MINNEKEIWRAHPNITGIEVSTFGRVRTLDRVTSSEKYTRFTKGHVLKQRNDKDGYLLVDVLIDGKRITKKAHRLVAQTFIHNIDNLPQVNHRDCDRKNNNVENLEWCTSSYDRQYREKYGVSQTEAIGNPVFAVNLNTNEVLHFRSQCEASRELGASQGNINNVIKGRYKQTCGFWFVNDDDNAGDAIKHKLNALQS